MLYNTKFLFSLEINRIIGILAAKLLFLLGTTVNKLKVENFLRHFKTLSAFFIKVLKKKQALAFFDCFSQETQLGDWQKLICIDQWSFYIT